MKLHWQILIAMALALFVGLVLPQNIGVGGVTLFSVLSFGGTLF